MFDEEQLNLFINKMIENATNTNSSAKEGLSNFRKYLRETKMCEESYLKKIDKIVECCDELVSLKAKAPSIDVTILFEEEVAITEKEEEKSPQKTLGSTKKTRSNRKNQTSSVCGGGNLSYSNICYGGSSSYSSSCGGGSSYTRRC